MIITPALSPFWVILGITWEGSVPAVRKLTHLSSHPLLIRQKRCQIRCKANLQSWLVSLWTRMVSLLYNASLFTHLRLVSSNLPDEWICEVNIRPTTMRIAIPWFRSGRNGSGKSGFEEDSYEYSMVFTSVDLYWTHQGRGDVIKGEVVTLIFEEGFIPWDYIQWS